MSTRRRLLIALTFVNVVALLVLGTLGVPVPPQGSGVVVDRPLPTADLAPPRLIAAAPLR